MVSVYSQVNQAQRRSEWGHCCDCGRSRSTWIGLTWEAGFIPARFPQIYWCDWTADPRSQAWVKQPPRIVDGNEGEWMFGRWWGKFVWTLWNIVWCPVWALECDLISCCFLLVLCNKFSFGRSSRKSTVGLNGWTRHFRDLSYFIITAVALCVHMYYIYVV